MIEEICDNCKHSEAIEYLGYLECNKRLELGYVVYHTDDWFYKGLGRAVQIVKEGGVNV